MICREKGRERGREREIEREGERGREGEEKLIWPQNGYFACLP